MIARRAVMLGLPSILAGAPGLAAQSMTPRGQIGYLHPNTMTAATYIYMAPVWRSLGYVEGRSVHVRSAQGSLERIPQLLAELAALKCDVLILVGPQTLKIATQHKVKTPIVAVDLESDPVQEGYANSIARPGGGITGLFMDFPELANKWLQLLKECVPGIERVAIVWDPTAGRGQVDAVTLSAQSIGLASIVLPTATPEAAIEALARLQPGPPTGALMLGSPARTQSDEPVTQMLINRRLPSIFHLRRYVEAGGLMSYGPRLATYFPRAVELAVRILGGALAGDLPIERPHQFDLTINMKTAAALDLTIPPSLLLRADEVIE